MYKSFALKVSRRNPFAVADLPFIARLSRAAYSKRRRVAKRFIGKPAKKLFHLAYHVLGIGGTGHLRLDVQGAVKTLPFNARNIQFSALYLPQNAGGYEPETAALIDVLVGDKATFYDIGCNWGYFALFIAARSGFGGHVHAIEPMPGTYADVSGLVAGAGLEGRITCHNVALSDAPGEGVMAIPGDLQSGLARLQPARSDGSTVALRTLDGMIEQDGLPPPDVIKIDVEGHEEAALEGAARCLQDHKPMLIFESWTEPQTPRTTLAPFDVLGRLGYTFFVPCWKHDAAGWSFADLDFLDTEQPVLVLIPVTAEQRFLMADQINVLACHNDSLPRLAELFNG